MVVALTILSRTHSECVNEYTGGKRFTRVDCGLTEVPTDIPSDAREVDLVVNRIRTVEAGPFSQLSRCTMVLLGGWKTQTFKDLNFKKCRTSIFCGALIPCYLCLIIFTLGYISNIIEHKLVLLISVCRVSLHEIALLCQVHLIVHCIRGCLWLNNYQRLSDYFFSRLQFYI